VVCLRVVCLRVVCLRFVCLCVVCLRVVCLRVVCLRVVCLRVVCLRVVCLCFVCLRVVCLCFVWGPVHRTASAFDLMKLLAMTAPSRITPRKAKRQSEFHSARPIPCFDIAMMNAPMAAPSTDP